MNLKYNLIKMIIGVGNVAFILYHSLSFDSSKGYRLWNIVFGILLIFMVTKSVTFTKKQEGIWIFLISAIALTPFNIRLAAIAANLYLIESFAFTKILFGLVIYLCILSVEEILLEIISSIIWSSKNNLFFYAEKKLEEDDILMD